MTPGSNSFNTLSTLNVDGQEYLYYSLDKLAQQDLDAIRCLPFTLKILLENILRCEQGGDDAAGDIRAFADWLESRSSEREIAFRPARVLMQDLTGVPAVVDLAAMRDAAAEQPDRVNPQIPVDLVIDHSVMVDEFASVNAFAANVAREVERNDERYRFLKWGASVFDNFRVVPPGTGICHQVNLEYLAKTVWQQEVDGKHYAFPDTLVGTDSHTTMINGLGVLGWGVGGIEAEAAMLGQPVSLLIPEVVGFRFKGSLREGITATDLVLTVTQLLREHGVVGKFVEFYGDGLSQLPLADRATLANMAPEYGATCGFFPVDVETLRYLRLSGRDEATLQLVESYCRAQGLWYQADQPDPEFSSSLTLDLDSVEASLAGPKRPQDRVPLSGIKQATRSILGDRANTTRGAVDTLLDGDVVIAAITSCTNTSNPRVMMAAGLLARNARALGLDTKPWVKTSLAPGSKVVTEYLQAAGLQQELDALGFNLVGYGCTTCIGNSGPLPDAIESQIKEGKLNVASVLSGNRNFEGRIHQAIKSNWLASPPLVVAYALAGSTCIDLTAEPIGAGHDGKPVYLRDIWPSNQSIADAVMMVNERMFNEQYADVFSGDDNWRAIEVSDALTYNWDEKSTYIRNPPYFQLDNSRQLEPIVKARILALLGDSITTDHISPAGAIAVDSPAGSYLIKNGVTKRDFNSYGSRRGNHELMMRGTFANIRIQNEMTPEVEGGVTLQMPTGELMSIYDAAMQYQQQRTPLVVIAGKEYGTGSSRDWAAKGSRLLGVRAVIAESFERIHRSNLIGMGVLPLQFIDGFDRQQLKLTGAEQISVGGMQGGLKPGQKLELTVTDTNGSAVVIDVLCRIDTRDEVAYYEAGGILQYVLDRSVN
ncbi:MAG: aconitate hydratase AcnA [Gammaproteobacteria bacterium]|jgi:aconitate hydratase|nr:aconitate hydratase AcnA [Gammaproteobacteria bacterium]